MKSLFPFTPTPTENTKVAVLGSTLMTAVLNGIAGGITLSIVAFAVKLVV